jgi:secondary thiamine-phosphate synthase enzyme
MIHTESRTVATKGRGTREITRDVHAVIGRSGIQTGLCNIFIHHTSASLFICENADPSVQRDLETFMSRIAPDGTAQYAHSSEGPDDMPAHIRSVLTRTSLSVPIVDGRADLGTWQGIFLWEHRQAPHQRRLTITIIGG